MAYKVKFDTGQTVSFDKQPTDADIEEVVKSLGIKPKTAINPEPAKPVQNKSLGQKVLDAGTAVSNFVGGKGIADTFGAELAKIGKSQQEKDFISQSQPSVKETVGSGISVGSNIAALALPGAGSIVGKAAQFGTIGATSALGKGLSNNNSAGEIAKDVAVKGAIGAGTGVAFGLAEKGIKGLANLLGKSGEKIQTAVIKPSQADVKDGFKIAIVNKYNLGGSLKQTFAKTDAKLDELSQQLNAKLKSSNASVDLNTVYENTARKLLGNKLESFGSNAQMEGAIEKLRNEITTAAGKNGIVSVPEAQIVKRASGHFGAWTFGNPTPEATASQKVYNTFYNELKTAIEKNSPEGVKQINQEISSLIPVMNAVIRRIPVAERNSAISLTDLITYSTAMLEPRALGLSLLNFASKSGKAGALLSKTPKAGQAVSGLVQKLEPLGRAAVSK